MNTKIDPPFDVTKLFPMTITHFGNKKHTKGKEEEYSWYEFCELMEGQPAVNDKDKQALIKMGTYENISRAGGSPLLNVTGIELDYDAGVVTAEKGAAMLREFNIRALVCSTHSSTASIHKWRVFLPLSDVYPAEQRESFSKAIAKLLDIPLDSKSFDDKQIFFVGRNPDAEYKVIPVHGHAMDLVPAVTDCKKELEQTVTIEAPKAPAPKSRPDGEISPIDAFNEIRSLGKVLEEYGYEKQGDKYLYPSSKSGKAGVSVSIIDGKEKAYSHHEGDPLANGQANDAFDCYRILEHGGDRGAALKAVGDIMQDADGVSLNQLNQANYVSKTREYSKGESDSKRFKITAASELSKLPPVTWLIKNVLPKEGLAAIYGPPGSGKSFLALDMLACIGKGKDWFGNKAKPVPVVYIPLEGQGGIPQRIKAYQNHHGDMPVNIVEGQMNLMEEGDREALIETLIDAKLNRGVICIDTLAACSPGMDENASTGMGALIDGLKQMQEKLGGLVFVVHHAGKDRARGLRGWSGLRGALDCSIEVIKEENGNRAWYIDKSKDGMDGGMPTSFDLKPVHLGEDEDDDDIYSCVINQVGLIKLSPEEQLDADADFVYNWIKKERELGKFPSSNSLDKGRKAKKPERAITQDRLRAAIDHLKKTNKIHNTNVDSPHSNEYLEISNY